jgi:hypothetical protein
MAENKSILAVPINGGFFSRCGDDHLIIPEESKLLVGYKCLFIFLKIFQYIFCISPMKTWRNKEPSTIPWCFHHAFQPHLKATVCAQLLVVDLQERTTDQKPRDPIQNHPSLGALEAHLVHLHNLLGVLEDSFPLDSQKMPKIFYGIHPKIRRSGVLPHSFCDCGAEVARNERTSKSKGQSYLSPYQTHNFWRFYSPMFKHTQNGFSHQSAIYQA